MSTEASKISVLLNPAVAKRFDAYCKQKGFKKSSLAARLILDHLDQELFQNQKRLFEDAPRAESKSAGAR
jgi:hypothetical protein